MFGPEEARPAAPVERDAADLPPSDASVDAVRVSVARAVVDMVDEGVIVADLDGQILTWNAAAEELTGYQGVDFGLLTLSQLLDQAPAVPLRLEDGRVDRHGSAWRGEIALRCVDGSMLSVSVRHKVVGRVQDGSLRQVLLVSRRGVSDLMTRPRRFGDRDQLTGLPNRAVLREQFIAKQQDVMRKGQRQAVLFIDVDRFKSVNDSVGHQGGDLFLQHVADRMAEALEGSGTLCRLAGNEFLAIATNIDSVARVSAIVERIRASLEVDFVLHGHVFRRTASIGIALYPDDGSDFDDLARKADMAKHLARRSGRNAVLFHAAEMTTDLERRRSLEHALAYAIEHGELFMRYQPQVDLHSGRIVGLEALVRWNWPGHGEISPNSFIPVAEESGLIVDLGPETFRLVCAQARAWHDAGIAVPVSVNISPVEIAFGDVDTRILEIIEESGLPPDLLSVEITESGLIDDTSKTEITITNLRESAVGLSIDDFLTGYSNFAYIRRFQASHLKIDRSFVTDIDVRPDNQAIVRAAVQMATALGIATIAEGVETEAEAATLRNLGCPVAQGYLYSKPLLASDVELLLRRGHCHTDLETSA